MNAFATYTVKHIQKGLTLLYNEKVCNLRSVVNANVNLSAELKLWGWGVSVSQDVFKGERALTDVVLQSPLRLLEK